MSSEDANSHTNPEIGRSLERARAERGLSLWQVEEATKIRARYLHDLERENFDVLPAVYVLGSLKTYADFLGLDGEALARELKSRQEPPPEERDPTPEEPAQSERGGFLAALGGLPLIGDRDAIGDDRGAAPAAGLGYGSRLYLLLGTVSILVLAIALTTILSGGDQPAVSQVREPAIPEAPSRIAFSGNAEDSKEDERNQEAGSKDDRPGEQVESSDGGDEKGKKEDEKDQAERSDQDDARPEDTGDVAVALPASITASASASATATSTLTASASASASSAATVPASTAPAATSRPPVAEPAVGQPTPGAASAPAGPRRVVAADGTRPGERIVGRVRIVRSFVRVR